MPSMNEAQRTFRKQIWELIDECADCDQEECPEWCREFVSCQIDELYTKVVQEARVIPASQ